MRNLKYIYFFILLLLFDPIKAGQNSLAFHGAYTFETFDGQRASAVYVSIFNNTNEDFSIYSVSTDVAERTEIHGIETKEEIVKMKKKKKLLIKSKEQVFLQPGGTHLMLMGLKKKLTDGSSFYLEFLLSNGNVNKVKVLVLNKKMRENFIE